MQVYIATINWCNTQQKQIPMATWQMRSHNKNFSQIGTCFHLQIIYECNQLIQHRTDLFIYLRTLGWVEKLLFFNQKFIIFRFYFLISLLINLVSIGCYLLPSHFMCQPFVYNILLHFVRSLVTYLGMLAGMKLNCISILYFIMEKLQSTVLIMHVVKEEVKEI